MPKPRSYTTVGLLTTRGPVPVPDEIRQAAAKVATRLDRDIVEQALAMYDAGWAPARIQRALFVAPSTLHGWRCAAAIPTNGSIGQDKILDQAEAQRTAELYESGKTIEQVAAIVGLTETGVVHRLDAAGIRRRPTGYAPGSLPRRLPDGFLSTIEAARIAGLSHVTVHRRCRRGGVPGARMFDVQGPGPRRIWGIPVAAAESMQRVRPPRRLRRVPEADVGSGLAQQLGKSDEVKEWLPAAPLAAWVAAHPKTTSELAYGSDPIARGLRRMLSGEQQLVALGWADAFLTRCEAHLADVWPDVEVALQEGNARWAQGRAVAARAGRAAQQAALDRVRAELEAEDRAA